MADYFVHKEKMNAVREAESKGEVADSMEVRLALIARMEAGELTLAQVKEELKRVKRKAKSNGQVTRAKAYRNG